MYGEITWRNDSIIWKKSTDSSKEGNQYIVWCKQ